MGKSNGAEIGFEKQIWEAADILRGNIDAGEYKHVVLGLIFLKYISDSFDLKYKQLLTDEYADAEDKDEYLAENIFFVPSAARWEAIANSAHTPEIGRIIDDAMLEIESVNPRLSGILPKNFAREELDKRRLAAAVAACLSSRGSLWKIILATLITYPFMVRTLTPPHGSSAR